MEAYKTAMPPKNPEFGTLFQQIGKKHQRQFTTCQQSALVLDATIDAKEVIYDTMSKKNPTIKDESNNWFLRTQQSQIPATYSMVGSDSNLCISQSCSKKPKYKNTGHRKGVASPGLKFTQFQPDTP